MSNATVLILEDQLLIALDVEDMLLEAGFSEISIFSSSIEAESWLETHTPDVAIVDMALRDGVCTELVQTLIERAVPFVVYSGSEIEDTSSVFKKGRWVGKPSQPATLLAAVQDALAGSKVEGEVFSATQSELGRSLS